jgi:DegV family protein with EDD domain
VVTDSTAYLPDGMAAQWGIRTVSLLVDLGGRTGREGTDISPDQVTEALRAHQAVTTSRPTPTDFVNVYRQILDAGAERLVSVHLSAQLSGTYDSARLAAEEFAPGQIIVVDSRATAMSLGFAVLAAADRAANGACSVVVAKAAVASVDRSSALFYVDSLEWLRRGGRIGGAAARLGTALSVKPLLHLVDGQIAPLERVRTASKALTRLVEIAVHAAGTDHVDLAVQHLASPERAAVMASELRKRIPNVGALYESQVGAVVGAHVGPGLIGVVIRRN